MAIEKIQAIRGMSDMLPEDAPLWHFFEKEASSLAKLYGYQHIRTPIVEQTRLFKRGIGEVTDIVEKEMYSFVDSLNGDELSLRPENTASVVRAIFWSRESSRWRAFGDFQPRTDMGMSLLRRRYLFI